MCKNQLIFTNGGKFEKLILIQICFYPSMPKISLIFRCPKGLLAILLKFANLQKSADFRKWREIWKAHINPNMFLPYHAKNQPHFQVSERIYSHFIEIGKFCKFAKISWLVARGDMHWPQQQSTLALTRAYQIFQKYGVRRYFRIGGQNWVVWAES